MVKSNPILTLTRTVQRDGVQTDEVDQTLGDTLGFILGQSDWSGFKQIHLYFDAADAQKKLPEKIPVDPHWIEGLNILLSMIEQAEEVGIPEKRTVVRGFSIGPNRKPDRLYWGHLYALRPALEEVLKAIVPNTAERAF